MDGQNLKGVELMKAFLENLAGLIKVKTMITIVVLFVFAKLSMAGEITAENVMVVVSTVIAFYFGTVSEKKRTGGNEQ
jgi:hypothetical protein